MRRAGLSQLHLTAGPWRPLSGAPAQIGVFCVGSLSRGGAAFGWTAPGSVPGLARGSSARDRRRHRPPVQDTADGGIAAGTDRLSGTPQMAGSARLTGGDAGPGGAVPARRIGLCDLAVCKTCPM